MEKNKLYKVNKWNKPAFMREGNVFAFGDNMAKWDRLASKAYGANYGDAGFTLDDYMNHKNSLGLSRQNNPFSKGNIGSTLRASSSIIGAIPTGERRGMFDTLDPLHHVADGRENEFGNAMGDAGVSLFQSGASSGNYYLMIAGAAAKGVGSLINAGWGVKENKENIEAIKQNTANARMVGNALAGVTDSKGFFDTAGEMTTGSGFSAGDLYKDGWFTSKGTRQGNALINKENNALAFQRHGMVTGAENVDSIMDDNVFSNFAAFGGHIPTIGAGTEDMPAINFGMWQDWLTGLNKRRKQASDNREANDYTNIGMGMRYDFGGDMQTNSADYSVGKVYDVSKEEANRLKAMGYEFTVVN